MTGLKSYENFPLKIVSLALFVSFISYIIGAFILLGFGIIFSILYLVYCFGSELLVVFRGCRNCYYYGKICGLGKGRIAPLFCKKGDPKKFNERNIKWYTLIPDFLVVIIPIFGAIILLLTSFSWMVLGLLVILAILFFGGTATIRGSFACKYCKQKELGCPADKMFNKEKKPKK